MAFHLYCPTRGWKMWALLIMNLLVFGCVCLRVNDSWLKTCPDDIPTLLSNQGLENAGLVKDEPGRFRLCVS